MLLDARPDGVDVQHAAAAQGTATAHDQVINGPGVRNTITMVHTGAECMHLSARPGLWPGCFMASIRVSACVETLSQRAAHCDEVHATYCMVRRTHLAYLRLE